MVERKKTEVDSLLRRHQAPDDPLLMRMSYMASECKFNMSRSLRVPTDPDGGLHKLSLIVDLKRRSPTIPEQKTIVEFSSAGKFAELLTIAKTDAFLINTEEMEYGGQLSDLKECVDAVKKAYKGKRSPPACINKDIIIHPIQIAQALENGASGVLLITSIVGADLEMLLDACTIMGTEALVEVHTPSELEYALSVKATNFLVNNWDRMSGILYPDQAKGLINMMPMNALAIVAGNIKSMKEVIEFGNCGYDGVVLGRNIAEVPDLKDFITGVHGFRGLPRTPSFGMGMKGNLIHTMQDY
eukprot:gene7915-9434_t